MNNGSFLDFYAFDGDGVVTIADAEAGEAVAGTWMTIGAPATVPGANSLKGYVPGHFGADFRALTRNANPESVQQWIMHRRDDALLQRPLVGGIATFFIDRQAVGMLGYASLSAEQIDTLVDYVIALNRIGPMTAKEIRSYAEQARGTASGRSNAVIRDDRQQAERHGRGAR